MSEHFLRKLFWLCLWATTITSNISTWCAFRFGGQKKSLDDYGPIGTGKAAATKNNDDDDDEDDDIDLFGSDDEVDEEAERIKEERLAAYAEKKSKSTYDSEFLQN